MAGDWIAMRTDLANDPAVIRIAELCGISRPHAVGCLHAVWSWFDQQTQDGDAPSVTETLTDSLTGVTGFARAMADDLVRWLEIRPGGGGSARNARHGGLNDAER